MKYLILPVFVLLSGCAAIGIPIESNFPGASDELMKQCEPLQKVETENVSIVELLKVVSHNYTLHHECSSRVAGWHLWYREQKSIHED